MGNRAASWNEQTEKLQENEGIGNREAVVCTHIQQTPKQPPPPPPDPHPHPNPVYFPSLPTTHHHHSQPPPKTFFATDAAKVSIALRNCIKFRALRSTDVKKCGTDFLHTVVKKIRITYRLAR